MATKDELIARVTATEADRNEVFLQSEALREETFNEWLANKDITVPDNETMVEIAEELIEQRQDMAELKTHHHDDRYATKESEHEHSNKDVLDGITDAKISEWTNKSDFSGSYLNLTDKPTIPTKVSELTNDSNFVDNTHNHDDRYANIDTQHAHDNKVVLDGITSEKVSSWDGKSEFSGNYNDLQNLPTIPSKNSQLDNDSDYVTHAELDEEMIDKLHNKKFMKKIFANLPLQIPNGNHQAILNLGVSDYIYPQNFTIDEDNEQIFILYTADGGITTRYIAVYDFNGNFITVFGAGNAGGEGIVVRTINESRFVFVKSQDSKLGKYDITEMPTELDVLSPVAEYEIGLNQSFNYRKGVWIVEQTNAPLGQQVSRTHFGLFDDEFNRIGSLNLNRGITGLYGTDSSDHYPKRQGIAIGDDFIYQSCGGYWGVGTDVTPFDYYGLIKLNRDGSIHSQDLMNPEKMVKILNDKAYITALRIENEGVYVDKDNNVYTCCIIENRNNNTWNNQGIIIFKEECIENGAINFKDSYEMTPMLNLVELERGVFPRAYDGNIYNPITGEQFTTINQVFKFMQDTEMKRFMTYTTSPTLYDIDGETLFPTGYLMTIQNANNVTFIVTLEGWAGIIKYCYYGDSMAEADRKKKEIFNNTVTE